MYVVCVICNGIYRTILIVCGSHVLARGKITGHRNLTINKKAASNAETAGILYSDFFEVRDSGTHSFALPTLAGVAFVLLDELLHEIFLL